MTLGSQLDETVERLIRERDEARLACQEIEQAFAEAQSCIASIEETCDEEVGALHDFVREVWRIARSQHEAAGHRESLLFCRDPRCSQWTLVVVDHHLLSVGVP